MSLNAMDSHLQKLIQPDDNIEAEVTDAPSFLTEAAEKHKCVEAMPPVSPDSSATQHAASSITADVSVNESSPLATQENGGQNLLDNTERKLTKTKRQSKKKVGTTN
jgi:hypothetical protein